MDQQRNKKPGARAATTEAERGRDTAEAERRRVGMVVHDDRGNASVSWHDAPADVERPVLEILGGAPLSIKDEESGDPYARRATRRNAGGARTDLRKLSEWIKMMRELEERKRKDGGER